MRAQAVVNPAIPTVNLKEIPAEKAKENKIK